MDEPTFWQLARFRLLDFFLNYSHIFSPDVVVESLFLLCISAVLLAALGVVRLKWWSWCVGMLVLIVSFSTNIYWSVGLRLGSVHTDLTLAPWIWVIWGWIGFVAPFTWIGAFWWTTAEGGLVFRTPRVRRVFLTVVVPILALLSISEFSRFTLFRDWWLPVQKAAAVSPDRHLKAIAFRTYGFDHIDELVLQNNNFASVVARRAWFFPEGPEPTELIWARDSQLVTLWTKQSLLTAFHLPSRTALRVAQTKESAIRDLLRQGASTPDIVATLNNSTK